MNLAALLAWADKMLVLLIHPSKALEAGIRRERLQEKLGWLEEHRVDLKEWREWHSLVMATEKVLRHETLTKGVVNQVASELVPLLKHPSGIELGKELVRFVAENGSLGWSTRRQTPITGDTALPLGIGSPTRKLTANGAGVAGIANPRAVPRTSRNEKPTGRGSKSINSKCTPWRRYPR